METLYKEFLKTELSLVQSHLDSVFQVEGALMREVADYIVSTRGKMLRPAVVCLVARALGHDGAEGHDARLGAAIELFHIATLLHDDVIDKAALRRGRDTVNARWGDDVAILMADYLYASSFQYALEVLNPEIVQVLSRTTQKMTEGEMYQIEKRGQVLSIDDYFSIIRSKTAYLFSAAAGLGALVSSASPATVQRLFSFGLNFGIAFQITDDALDYEARDESWGKQLGSDLREGKQTLPLLRALHNATGEDRNALIAVLSDGRDFETVHHYVKKYRGIDEALSQAGDYTRRAIEELEELPDSEALQILRQITDGVLVRQH